MVSSPLLILHVPDMVPENEPIRILALSLEPGRVPGIYVELHLVAWQSSHPGNFVRAINLAFPPMADLHFEFTVSSYRTEEVKTFNAPLPGHTTRRE